MPHTFLNDHNGSSDDDAMCSVSSMPTLLSEYSDIEDSDIESDFSLSTASTGDYATRSVSSMPTLLSVYSDTDDSDVDDDFSLSTSTDAPDSGTGANIVAIDDNDHPVEVQVHTWNVYSGSGDEEEGNDNSNNKEDDPCMSEGEENNNNETDNSGENENNNEEEGNVPATSTRLTLNKYRFYSRKGMLDVNFDFAVTDSGYIVHSDSDSVSVSDSDSTDTGTDIDGTSAAGDEL